MITLDGATWRTRRDAHHSRVDALLEGHRHRSSRAIKHPVEDFLFEYYSFRPYELRRWHPGVEVLLLDADELAGERFHVRHGGGVRLDHDPVLAHRASTVRWADRLLRAVAGRRPAFGCFGMHEWAMVAGLAPDQVRHRQLGLRLPPERIEQTLDDLGLRCTHIDAYRFFTPGWQPRNAHRLTRANQVEHDQPGCLHVGMDLYRIAYKLAPMLPAELTVDCFELARDIRVLDMRASPYDLTSLGYAAVEVDTDVGRADYVRQQRAFAARAEPLRARLGEHAARLVELLDGPGGSAVSPADASDRCPPHR